MEITIEVLKGILDAYVYEVIFVDRQYIVQYMNQTAKQRYGNRVEIGNSLFNCHNEKAKVKIEEFLKRADNGENEMFEVLSDKTKDIDNNKCKSEFEKCYSKEKALIERIKAHKIKVLNSGIKIA